MQKQTKSIRKVVRIGTIPVYQRTAEKPTDIHCVIEFRDSNELSITGVIGARANGDAWGSCGQINMGFAHRNPAHNDKRYWKLTEASEITYAEGWNSTIWLTFLEIWRTYHLFHSNCEHQALMGITYHDNPHHICHVCGYKIGSAWKQHQIPNAVIEFLCALPDADKALPEVWNKD